MFENAPELPRSRPGKRWACCHRGMEELIGVIRLRLSARLLAARTLSTTILLKLDNKIGNGQVEEEIIRFTNFAIANATVLGSPPETVNKELKLLTLSQQVMKFSENKNKWTHQARSEAIYLFYIGSDEYLNYAKNNPSPSDDQKKAFVDRVISFIEAELKVIYGSGGRKFAFQNLAPLGCLPVVKQANGNVKECMRLPSEMAEMHNKKLLQILVELSRQLTFETGIAACCGTGSINGSSCSTNNVCANPEDYLFFDGKHLTQEGNLQARHLMWGSDPEVIGPPNNLRELLFLPLDSTVILADIQEAMAATRPSHINVESLYDIKKKESEMENNGFIELIKLAHF
ncbi:hypothetical protein Bca101_067924 [Brassica carinata]